MSEQTKGKLELEEVASDSGHIKHLCPVDSEGMSLLTVVEHEGVKFAAVYNDDDSRRIVAAWNWCDGIPTEKLEASDQFATLGQFIKLSAERDSLRAVNAELLAALEGVICALDNGVWSMVPNTLMETQMRAAIAKANALKGDSHEQG